MTDEIIIVSGLFRSGTSMMMRMLSHGGVEIVADSERADEHNPHGYFEWSKVKEVLLKPELLKDKKGKAIKVISREFGSLPKGYDYKVIIMKRNLEEIHASRTKMGIIGDVKFIKREEDNFKLTLSKRPKFKYIEVEYSKVIKAPKRETDRIIDFLGMDLDRDKMGSAVDKKLYRNQL